MEKVCFWGVHLVIRQSLTPVALGAAGVWRGNSPLVGSASHTAGAPRWLGILPLPMYTSFSGFWFPCHCVYGARGVWVACSGRLLSPCCQVLARSVFPGCGTVEGLCAERALCVFLPCQPSVAPHKRLLERWLHSRAALEGFAAFGWLGSTIEIK